MATEAVFKYLQDSNRPYSANDIVQNMHKEFSKTQVQKCLDELVGDGRIFEKIYGKQKVYCIKQSEAADVGDDAELKELNDKIKSITNLLKSLKSQMQTDEIQVKQILSKPTTEEALMETKKLAELNEKSIEKIELLKKSTNLIPDDEKQRIIMEKTATLNEYKKRKRLCTNVINEILENYPKSKKVLLDEIGIDEDGEDVLSQIQ